MSSSFLSTCADETDPHWIGKPFWSTLPEDAQVYNFAYGANCCSASIKSRKLEPIESIPARLPGFRVNFRLVGLPLIEPSFADVEHTGNMDEEIHGVLHLLSRRGWRRLQVTEGGQGVDRRSYVPHKVTAYSTKTGEPIEAYVLMTEGDHRYQPNSWQFYCAPSQRYVDKLKAGANFGVEARYIDAIEQIPTTVAPLSHKLCVALCLLPTSPLVLVLLAFGKHLRRNNPAALSSIYRTTMALLWLALYPLVVRTKTYPEPITFSVPATRQKSL